MKEKNTKASLGNFSCFSILVFILISSLGKAQIKLNYKNYLVPASVIYSYKGALGGVNVPSAGTNQVWDYSAIVNTPTSVSEPYIPETNPVFSAARRQRIINVNYGGGLSAIAYEHSSANNASFKVIGLTTKRVAYTLSSSTGNSNDSIILLAQNVNYGGNQLAFPYPCTYLTNWQNNTDYSINLEISLASQGLNHAPLKFSKRISSSCIVEGWGTMRIPTASGPSDYIPSLMMKTITTQVDSFFVNGVPASNAVLSLLGFTQGQITNKFLYQFKRVGIEQDLITFYMTNSNFNAVDKILYDRKHTDLYCLNNCQAKMCVSGVNTVCLTYSTNAANNAMLLNNARLGECEATRIENDQSASATKAIVYPNPSTNQFSLLLNDDGEIGSIVSVYDFSGRLIHKMEDVNGLIEFGMDFTPGIYSVLIQTGEVRQQIKVIKSH